MSLINQTCWVVGGVGVIGRGIARSFLQAGATVIVNSSDESRLQQIASDLHHPSNLVLVQGDFSSPTHAQKTVEAGLAALPSDVALRHVVAHGAVRYWTEKKAGCDETYSLDSTRMKTLMEMDPDEFLKASSQLATLHFCAAKNLLPALNESGNGGGEGVNASYTFVTGDGGGHVSGKRSAFGEINSHHIWGLSAALREELKSSSSSSSSSSNAVTCREVRVGLPVNRPMEERENEPRDRPLSEDIGDLCAGVAASSANVMNGELIAINSQRELEDRLIQFNADKDKNINLPHIWEFNGSL